MNPLETNMTPQEALKKVRELRAHIEYLGRDEVDDPEDTMNELACESPTFLEALDVIIGCIERPGQMG